MFKKILVCLDGSQLAEQIVPYVLSEALAFKSKVILLKVLSIPSLLTPDLPGFPGVPVHTSSTLDKVVKEKDRAKEYLEQISQPLRKKGLRVECITLEGPPGSTITSYANENKVDLIAIATHGHSGLRHLLFGSVAEVVIRDASVPILMIKPKHPDM
jgi:nucleotide-binding universal stress UspA family protein